MTQFPYDISMALDAAGNPHIVYTIGVNDAVKYAKRVNGTWIVTTIAKSVPPAGNSTTGVTSTYFSNGSIDLDSNGYPSIAYSSRTVLSFPPGVPGGSVKGQLRYARWTGSAWVTQYVLNNPPSGFISLALDSYDKPHISYIHTGESLYYAKQRTVFQNLIQNPGFESGTTGWTFPAEGSVVSGNYHTGRYSAKIVRTTQGTSSIVNSPRINVTAGQSYTVEGWMKWSNVSGTNGARIAFTWFDAAGVGIKGYSISGLQLGTGAWAKYTKTLTAPSNAVTGRFALQLSVAQGTVWFDDLSLIKNLAGTMSTDLPADVVPLKELAAAPAPVSGTEQAVQPAAAVDLSQVKVYPNPYEPGSGGSQDAVGITFENLTAEAKIAIYTVSGEKVVELNETDGDGLNVWATRNASGEPVASGIYVYKISNSNGEKRTGRVAVVR